jgi:hypothetical protein
MADYEKRIEKQRDFYTREEKDFLLGVRINPQQPSPYPYEELLSSPGKALDTALSFLKPSLKLDTDFVPCLYPIQFRMIHPIPSLFGCDMRIVSDDVRVVPIIEAIEQVWDMEVPDLERGVLPKVIEHLEYYKKNAPQELPIAPPSEQSPFVIAYQLRGDAIFLDLYDHPQEVEQLLKLITDTFIRVERLYKEILNEPNGHRVSFQYLFVPGLRIAADSDVMLSPEFVEEFEMPYLKRIAGQFGSLAIHYCGNPATTGHQFADVLSGYDFVKLVHTQLGPYLDDSNANRVSHTFKLASIWEIDDFPGFLRNHVEKLRQSRGAMFFVQVKTRKEAKALIRRWPELRAELLD